MPMTGYLNQDGVKEIGATQMATYTATAADATANAVTVQLNDLPSFEIHLIQVYRAGVLQDIAGVTVTASENTFTVADGGTFAVADGDVFHVLAAGKVTE